MTKVHTRVKRSFGLTTGLSHYRFFHQGIKKKNRPKTFNTEEGANAWASGHGLKTEQYCLKKAKHNKKFQVDVYNKGKNTSNNVPASSKTKG